MIPVELVNKIIMMSRPTYKYFEELERYQDDKLSEIYYRKLYLESKIEKQKNFGYNDYYSIRELKQIEKSNILPFFDFVLSS